MPQSSNDITAQQDPDIDEDAQAAMVEVPAEDPREIEEAPAKRPSRAKAIAAGLGIAAVASVGALWTLHPAPAQAAAADEATEVVYEAPMVEAETLVTNDVVVADMRPAQLQAMEDARSLLEVEDTRGALQKFQLATLIDAHDVQAWYGMALCLTELHRDGEAREAINRARWENPLDPRINVLAGFLAQMEGSLGNARSLYQRSLVTDPAQHHELGAIVHSLPHTLRAMRASHLKRAGHGQLNHAVAAR